MKKITLIITVFLLTSLLSVVSQGTEPRYKIYQNNNAPTVEDNLTGLMWQQNSTASAPLSWVDALKYCEELKYAGYTDWRLPQIAELLSIVDEKKKTEPAINTVYFSDFIAGSGFWTSTTSRSITTSAYAVYFNEQNSTVGRGGVSSLSKTGKAQTLCVRTSH